MSELEDLAGSLEGKLRTMAFHGEPLPVLPPLDVWSDLEVTWELLTAKQPVPLCLQMGCDKDVTVFLQLLNREGSSSYWQGFCTEHSLVVAVEWKQLFGPKYVMTRSLVSMQEG